MKQIISIHYNALSRGIKKGHCELYAFGEHIWLTSEECAEWFILQDKPSWQQKRFVKKLAKQEGKRVK